ncbi:MAG TPA: alpha/beta fold hydrolase [Candidatus Limnocylindrales bacterium]|nr:alpha/beta fold hydrolase [Candidatus Limnocylindrales bacterium]
MGDWIDLDGTDGGRAWLARPASNDGPGVIVLHAWWGLNETIRAYADRLADEGFVALAPDLFHGTVTDTIDAADVASSEASEAEVMRIIEATASRLRADEGELGRAIGVVGFSFGAAFALALAVADPAVDAVVVHYGTWPGLDWSRTQASFLGHFAEDDPYESRDAVETLRTELDQAGREVRFATYPETNHWFVEPDRPEYDEAAAQLAWDRTVAFLRENLGPLGA